VEVGLTGRHDSLPAPDRPVHWGRAERAWSALGVFAVAVIAVSVNILVARRYTRWDWTSSHLYTLSAPTLQTLHELSERVEFIVLLGRSDPAFPSLQQILESYRAESAWIVPRFVDPDRSPGEFLAVQHKYGIVAGRTENGRVVTDAIVVIARSDRRWYVTPDDIVSYDEERSEARPQLESTLTQGLRHVLVSDRSVVCFTTGHEEVSIEDVSPTGLAELARRLEKDNYEVRSVNLGEPSPASLSECSVVVVAAPDVPLEDRASSRIADFYAGGGNVLVLASAGLDDQYRVRNNGLEQVVKAAGIGFGDGVVVEGDAERRLPGGFGETFFAEPESHPITRGLIRRTQTELAVLVTLSQPLERIAGAPAESLLVTSPSSFELTELGGVMAGEQPTRAGRRGGPFSVAMATELPNPKPGVQTRGPRLVVAPASIGFGRNWHDPALIGTRRFMESVVSWLSSRPLIVSVPAKAAHPIGLALTEGSLGEVWRYVLLYMPGSALLLALLVFYRRRIGELPRGAEPKSPRHRRKPKSSPRRSSPAGGARP
jgi:hypothetical protein